MNYPSRLMQNLLRARLAWPIGFAVFLATNSHSHGQAASESAAALMTNLAQVCALSDDALRYSNYQARVQGVISYIPPQGDRINFQDGPNAIYADFTNSVSSHEAGERIELSGPLNGVLVARLLAAKCFD